MPVLTADKVLVTIGTPCSMSAVGGTETYLARVCGKPEFIAYAAFDAQTNRPCVLKLSTGRSAEAQVIGGLRHPNVIDVYWARPVGWLSAVCMPLVGTTTLAEARESLAIAGERASADVQAHGQLQQRLRQARERAGQVGDLLTRESKDRPAVNARYRRAVRITRQMGSATLSLAYVANGRFDAYVQWQGLSTWDICAAGVIAQEGGAVVTSTLGNRWFDIGMPSRSIGIVAAMPQHHGTFLEMLT